MQKDKCWRNTYVATADEVINYQLGSCAKIRFSSPTWGSDKINCFLVSWVHNTGGVYCHAKRSISRSPDDIYLPFWDNSWYDWDEFTAKTYHLWENYYECAQARSPMIVMHLIVILVL